MLTETQNLLLSALRCFIAGEKYQAKTNTDWKALAKESIEQAVTLSCLQGLDENQIPKEILKSWQGYAMRSLSANIQVHGHHSYLHDMMAEASIPYVILKGSASAYYYSDPLMRSMGDVDFWVPETYWDKTLQLFSEQGWVAKQGEAEHHIELKKDDMVMELHHYPAGVPSGEAGERVMKCFEGVFELVKEVEVSGERFRMLCDFHHGLVLLLHTYHHVVSGGGIGIRHLCDWAVYVQRFEGESFAQTHREKLEEIGLWKFAQILSYTSFRYLGIPYCEWMQAQDEAFCEAFILGILEGGNFGRKTEGAPMYKRMHAQSGKGEKKKRKLSKTFAQVNEAGRRRYPRLAKIPILKHFCFIPMGFRYFFNWFRGKNRGKKILDSVEVAEAQNYVYEEFELFEVKNKK